MTSLSPQQFVKKWSKIQLKERTSAQSHFNDVCALVGHKLPLEEDPTGKIFTFEADSEKVGGEHGWADAFYQGKFIWEYKGPYKDLDKAYQQLLLYKDSLGNPPLLITSDTQVIRVHTNFTNTVKKIYTVTFDTLLEGSGLDILRSAFFDPISLRPTQTQEQITQATADEFIAAAHALQTWADAEGQPYNPEQLAHFLGRLLFCLFAEDISLLPQNVFSRMVHTNLTAKQFEQSLRQLFAAMRKGGIFGMDAIPYFDGGLFDDDFVPDNMPGDVMHALRRASEHDWASIDPSIFGTLFERIIDESKRAQLGAHYTSKDDILLVVEPVLMEPLRRKWQAVKWQTAQALKDKLSDSAQALLQAFSDEIAAIRLLDPACGSGNFLYLGLRQLMDLQKQVITFAGQHGLAAIPLTTGPQQLFGIEINPYAHQLAQITVWIGYLQWRHENGLFDLEEPILRPLQQIENKDAILTLALSPTPNPPLTPYSLTPSPTGVEGEKLLSPILGEGNGEMVEAGQEADRWVIPETLRRKMVEIARQFRKEPTRSEAILWKALRGKKLDGFKFRRQQNIGPFVVDFYNSTHRLVIEIDGPVHESQKDLDRQRQELLEALGLCFVRLTAKQVENDLQAALDAIRSALTPYPLTPSPTEGGRGKAPYPLTPSTTGGEGEKLPSPFLGEGPGVRVVAQEPTWPAADVIIGNPPFLGGQKIRAELGNDYVSALFTVYGNRLPSCDMVCYWFEKARKQIEEGQAKRAGLLATNSIRGGANRKVLERIKQTGDIFWAQSDREWILEGAAVNVSMVGFDNGSETNHYLDDHIVDTINTDLTGNTDLTKARRLTENTGISFMGDIKVGDFDIDASTAEYMLVDKNNPNGRPNRDVIRPWVNGLDITRRYRNMWIIDFGVDMPEDQARQYILPFDYVEKHVKPFRVSNNMERRAKYWWIHGDAAPRIRQTLEPLERFLGTPNLTKYRLFIWLASPTLPDHQLIVFARSDDYFFGVLHSHAHEIWALRQGTSLEDRPRYTPTTTFETFPFPWPPGKEPGESEDPRVSAIAQAARQLDEFRTGWLNPPAEDIGVVISPKIVEKRTLTNLYNALGSYRRQLKGKQHSHAAWQATPHAAIISLDEIETLDRIHTALDQAVLDAYGWQHALSDDQILERLLALNLQRASA